MAAERDQLFVPDAHLADEIVVVARTASSRSDQREGLSLFLVPAADKR